MCSLLLRKTRGSTLRMVLFAVFRSSSVNDNKPVRPFFIAGCAALLALVLNGVLRAFLKFEGMPATIGIAFGVGGLIALWFAAAPKRAPTPQERTRILWWYVGLLSIPSLLVFAGNFAVHGLNLAGLFILSLHLLAYPAAAQFFLSEKRMNAFLAKRS